MTARKYYSLYGRLLSIAALKEAFKHVKKNRGAAGIDGQSVENFARDLESNVVLLKNELQEKRYQPLPVRRVDIEKQMAARAHWVSPAFVTVLFNNV
jgi:RNA-directed DNA polymerase